MGSSRRPARFPRPASRAVVRPQAPVRSDPEGIEEISPGSRSAPGVQRAKNSAVDPFGVREPQWLGTKYAIRRKGEAMKGGSTERRSLPVRVRARAELLARTLRHRAEVSSQVMATGSTGEGRGTKGPGEETPGDGISAGKVRQSPPLDEALAGNRNPRCEIGRAVVSISHQPRGSCRRLEKMVLNHDR